MWGYLADALRHFAEADPLVREAVLVVGRPVWVFAVASCVLQPVLGILLCVRGCSTLEKSANGSRR